MSDESDGGQWARIFDGGQWARIFDGGQWARIFDGASQGEGGPRTPLLHIPVAKDSFPPFINLSEMGIVGLPPSMGWCARIQTGSEMSGFGLTC